MEDLLRVIFIIAIIGIAIVKGVNKSLKTAQPKQDIPPRPPLQPQPQAGGSSPLPEAWGGLNIPTNPAANPQPQPMESTMRQPVTAHQTSYKQPKKQKHRTGEVEAQAKAYRNPVQNRNIASTSSSTSSISHPEEEDFTLRSAEEARRAIIWGEILQRKY